MSKTASSAASVGMSFENTTAMIATMVEATRESATNIGSAMKSIISRMSEMKAGLSQDENGEFLDASKVETALKSVGVALRDSQGQFRDLDTVIIELGSKWSTLDSATKRYLGTIIAGNRQQSRFLALMENYERFTEIQESAMNAEDASVLQYAKTLDSLGSKLNQIRNSFQQFYMEIVNGPVISEFLNVINNAITNLSQLPAVFSVPKILSIISSIKNSIQLIFTLISTSMSNMIQQLNQRKNEIFNTSPSWAQQLGERIGRAIGEGIRKSKGVTDATAESVNSGINAGTRAATSSSLSNRKANVIRGLTIAGSTASIAGLGLSQNTMAGYVASNTLQFIGGSLLAVGQFLTGNPIGGTITAITTLTTAIKAFTGAAEQASKILKQELEDANITRVEDKKAASDLQSYITKYNKLRDAQYDSAEAAEEFTKIQNEIAEKYPQYISYVDDSGNSIVDMTNATGDLVTILNKAAKSTKTYSEKLIEVAENNKKNADIALGLNDNFDVDTLNTTELSIYKSLLSSYSQAVSNVKGAYDKASKKFSKKRANNPYWGLTQDELDKEIENHQNSTSTDDEANILKSTQLFEAVDEYSKAAEELDEFAVAYDSAQKALNSVIVDNKWLNEDYLTELKSKYRDVNPEDLSYDQRREYLEQDTGKTLQEFIADINNATQAYRQAKDNNDPTATGLGAVVSTMTAYAQMLLGANAFDIDKETGNISLSQAYATGLSSEKDVSASIRQAYQINFDQARQSVQYKGKAGAGNESWLFDVNNSSVLIDALMRGEGYNIDKNKTNSINEVVYRQYAEQVFDAINNASEWFSEHGELLGQFLTDASDFSQTEVLNLISSLNETDAEQPVSNALKDIFAKEVKGTWARFYRVINGEAITQNENESDADFITRIQEALGADYSDLLKNTSVEVISGITKIITVADEIIKAEGGNNTIKKQTAEAQRTIGILLNKVLGDEELSQDAKNAFQNWIQSSDFGTVSWKEEGAALVKKYAGLQTVVSQTDAMVLDGFDARLNALTSVSGQLEDLESAQSKQLDSGFTFEEAKKLKSDLGLKEELASLFKIDSETGLFRLVDWDKIQKEVIENAQQDIKGINNLFTFLQENATIDLLNVIQQETSNLSDAEVQAENLFHALSPDTQNSIQAFIEENENWRELLPDYLASIQLPLQWITAQNKTLKNTTAANKNQKAYNLESTVKEVKESFEQLTESLVKGEVVSINDVVDLLTSAGVKEADINREGIAELLNLSVDKVIDGLKAQVEEALKASEASDEQVQQALADISLTIVDAITDAIEEGISLMTQGITDGLSGEELKSLAQAFRVPESMIASYDQSTGKYRTSSEQFISTLTTSPMMKGRDTYAYSRQLTETLGGKDGVLGSYESITKEIERVEKNINECTAEEKARLKILKEMQAVYANTADSQRFDFMGYDMMQGQMDDFDNWIDSIQQAQDVFQGLSDNDGKMNYKNFLSMIDYIQKFHPDASSLQIAGQSLDQFAVAIMNTVDIAGNVDFSAVADAMTQGVGQMADAMKETLAEVARERIKTLEATKAALVAQLAVQKALESMQLKPEDMQVDWSEKNPVEDWITRINDSGKKAIDMMDDLTEEQKAASKAYLDSFPIGKQILDALGFKPEDMAKWKEDQQNAFNQIMAVFSSKIPDIMSQAAENVQASGISYSDSEQWGKAYYKEFQRLVLIGWETAQSESQTTFEAPNAKIVGDAQIEGLSTTTTTTISSEADNTTKALTDTASAISNAEEAFKNFGQTGQEEIGKIKTAITDLVTQLDSLKESFNLGTTETPMGIQLKAVIDEYTNAPGVDPNKQVENLNGTVGSFVPTAEGSASKTSLVDGLVATVDKFLPAPGVDKNSLVSDLTALVKLSSNPEDLYKNIVAYMSAKKVSIAVQLANDGNEEALANLWGDLSPAEQSLVALNATSETAVKTLKNVASNYALIGAAAASTGLAVNTSETNNQEKLAGTNDAVNNVSTKYGEVSTAAGEASTAITNAETTNQGNIKATGDKVDATKGKLDAMAGGDYTITVGANTDPAISATESLIRVINSKSAVITVTQKQIAEYEEKFNGSTPPSGLPKINTPLSMWSKITQGFANSTLKKKGGGKYQGTVNDLGPAYAQGTKTLVGELGPELAVYDNAYHLLGRNGAELVDIPDDAIIFNHKQTEGILKGQANNGRGKTVNGQPAFATGNVSGPAYAGGLSGAIAAIDREIMAWKALLSMTTADLLGSAGGGGGGGGSGNTLKAHIEDLVEWYNLTRQIADIEQKINNIIAKRANITDGRAYLKSLREQQHLLEGQALAQKTLLGYQQKQLELQAEQINTHDIWKQFFHVGSDGLLQYNMGNEVNGGKGTLTLLQQLNQMSGAEQLSYIKNLGYSYVTNDGEQLDGEDLISKFFEEAQAQIDKYDELRDTVESTDEALSKLESSINEIEQEIRDNQKELEEIIYNTLVEAWEKQISQLQEQTDMLREANEAYVNGLNDALNKERNQYSQNKSISDRQQLQRQLSLLRRSGGSASQIASLEEQLNSALKEEYFSHQQETIDSIKEANDKQLDALNKQITLQQETLDFQKENGVLWTKVYEVLSQSDGKIMEFLIQNSSEFIQASALAQADMLNEEWAKRIGIYKANSEEGFEPYVQKANQLFATEAWNSAEGPQKQSMFNALDVASQKALQDYFASAFANEMLRNGGDEAAAYEVARQDMYQKLYQAYNQMKNIQNTTLDAIRNISQPSVAPKDNAAGTGGGGSGVGGSGSGGGGGGGSSSTTKKNKTSSRACILSAGNKGGSPFWAGGGTSMPGTPGRLLRFTPNPDEGYTFDHATYAGKTATGWSITVPEGTGDVDVKVYYKRLLKRDDAAKKAKESTSKTHSTSTSVSPARLPSNLSDAVQKKLLKNKKSVLYADSGALVGSDNTPAILHKGEGVFTAGETSALRNMVKNYQTIAANLTGNSLLSAISGIGSYSFSNTRNAGSELNINPGAVVIHIDKLDDKYDVDELATDVFNKLSTIASKATNRGVNRR